VAVGVKVTLCAAVPGPGAVLGVVKVKLPGTEVAPETADPPVSVEEAKVCP
jgi:hypothetical protein